MNAETPGAGSSSETAVVVRTLWAEYLWLREHRRDGTVVSRREMWEADRLFDILTVKSDSGDTREIYFDVSACAAQRQPPQPCPYCGEALTTVRAKQCGKCFADFHDPARVVFRKGRDHVDRVREACTRRRELEALPPGLADPWTAFTEHYRPKQATPGVFVLQFPSRLSALDERLFRVGIDCLIEEGCRSIVCHLHQPLGDCSVESDRFGILVSRILLFSRLGLRAVLVGGGQLTAFLADRRAPVNFANYETEDEAVASFGTAVDSR